MDIITQGILGACVAQAGFSRELGRRALGWGAVIGIIPDFDVIVKISSNPFAEILWHRGITHSIWFGPLIGSGLGYLLWHYYQKRDALHTWISLSICALITHPLLDLFTVYGTQLLSPFLNHRFSIPSIPIIDPIYTGMLIGAVIFGYVFHQQKSSVIIVACIALTLTSGYLFYGLAQNNKAYTYARNQLALEGFPNADVRVYPTIFQVFLRRIVVHFPKEIWIGFVTTWVPKKIIWHKQSQAPLYIRQAILNHRYGKIYDWFTNNELVFCPHEKNPGKWDIFDSRFGLPGFSILGLWGCTVTLDKSGLVYDDFSKFHAPLRINFLDIIDLWKRTFRQKTLNYSNY